ncbi:MAG: HdeD family acid-resistance protein [Pseudomonadota bacterium]
MSATDTADFASQNGASDDTRSRVTGPRRWPYLVIGLFSVLAGFIAIAMPFVATLSASLLLGAVLLANGVVTLFSAFRDRETKRLFIEIIVGVLSIIGGAALFVAPLAGALSITILLASFFAASGVMRLIWAARHRQESGTGWLILGGLLSIALAVLLFLELPFNAFWVPGLFLGIDLVFNGVAMISLWAATRRDTATDEG